MLKVGWEFPGVQWLDLVQPWGPGSILGLGTRSPRATWRGQGKEKKRKKLVKQFCQFRERIFPESVSFGAAEMESLVDGAIRLG